jgi:hypothetical protein
VVTVEATLPLRTGAVYDARIGDDGNTSPGSPRNERAGTVGAGAEAPANILPEPLPQPGADGPLPQ